MFIIGLTGGIACGKSAISYILKQLGAVAFDVDEETHHLLQPGGELYEIYVEHFGEKILMDNGKLDRKVVGEIIFHDEGERRWINSVAHPILLNHTRNFLVDCAECGIEVVVLEIPLLFEAGWQSLVDEVWAVYLPREFQIYRLVRRDRITPEQAAARISAQMSVEEICRRADVVIHNLGTQEKLHKKIVAALKGKLQPENLLTE